VNMNTDSNIIMTDIDEQIKKNWGELLNLVLNENTKSSMLIQICENKRLKNIKYKQEIKMLQLETQLLEKRLLRKRSIGTQTGM